MGAFSASDRRVAILVDCDNTSPAILDHAIRVAAQFGQVVVRRGYGTHTTLGHRWQDALMRQSFTPHLQYQYVAGKNTSDIALALDALEILLDKRADHFCFVTSDSDFAYLCRKLRERGAAVCIVGEAKTPDALRNASEHFFEWVPTDRTGAAGEMPAPQPAASKDEQCKPTHDQLSTKRRPRFVVDAVNLLASDSADGQVSLSSLGQYLKRANPDFSPAAYGHSGLLNMLKTYDLLSLAQQDGGHYARLRVATAEPVGEPEKDPCPL
jgi:uncharacterized protein (TIGR00288 family)